MANRRLAYIDWMRGLACLLMFQTHCYDSWLSPEARNSLLYRWSQLLGTAPAPIFLFLCGVSFALVTERLWEKGTERDVIARQTIWRGFEIYLAGELFRVQEFVLGYPRAPWTDLLRVDVLNILGIAMMLMGAVCWLATSQRLVMTRRVSMIGALALATVVAMVTPVLYTTHRLQFLPWPIESYIDGVHTFNAPQPWLFPIFPWIAFAFAGLAAGFFLFTDIARCDERIAFASIGVAGALSCVLSIVFDKSPISLYAVYDYWHTSPQFLLMRTGIMLLILFGSYAWCQWGLAQRGFSPVIQLGKTSLLVYWVHIEFVYGRLSILPKRQCGIGRATLGLCAIFIAMLILSILRTNWKGRKRAAAQAPCATPLRVNQPA
ncbi:MAG TPA: heparan-alpha-glucosaminide N-acetyltransferase domain-containing protein [Candidatus Acidoferrum sp.]|nr:heparan-alpha-glucosaminide N-acetyltransferase domain-containing protein [Candidatus Acidoferrum sp.]